MHLPHQCSSSFVVTVQCTTARSRRLSRMFIEGHEEYSMVAFHLNAEGMLVAHRQCWCMSLSWQLQNILTAAVCLRQRQVLAVLVP